ncbi:hypothetical protein KKD49_18325 [Myxococcota bacterium]|nr:hypothetical protein [Myxococcota bacterium]
MNPNTGPDFVDHEQHGITQIRLQPTDLKRNSGKGATTWLTHIHRFSAKNGVSEGIKNAEGIENPWWVAGTAISHREMRRG